VAEVSHGPTTNIAAEEAVCPLCGRDAPRTVFRNLPDWLCGLPGRFNIVECRACGMRYLNPRPAPQAIGQYYPESYAAHVDAGSTLAIRGRRVVPILRRAADLLYSARFGPPGPPLKRPRPEAHVLDVGCGTGGLLLGFQKAGWSVTGLDTSPGAVSIARSRLSSQTIYVGDVHTLDLPRDTFDLVLMSHALEHVYQPRDTLRRVRDLLRPNGRLWVAVPDASSWEARLFREDWIGYDVPRHFTNFSRANLLQMLRSEGFKIVRVRPQLLPVSISDSVNKWLERKLGIRWRRPQQVLTYYGLYLPVILTYWLGNSGAIEVEAANV